MSEDRTAREEILGRIRTALPVPITDVTKSYASVIRDYRRTGVLDREASLELFIDRLLDYDTEILQIDAEEGLAEAVAEALTRHNEIRVLAAKEFPDAWLPPEIHVVRDAELSTLQLDQETAVVTTCEAAVATTGTIFLVHEGAQGRRALTLLPDHHICLVRRDQIFETLSEALHAVSKDRAKPLTTISGPSATSDIEMTRIRGVHGPRRLTVILYGWPLNSITVVEPG